MEEEVAVPRADLAAPPVVELTGVSKTYGAVKALRGVDFSLMPGEIVGLIGANGAGKSTLIKVITGRVVPDSGVLRIGGKATSEGLTVKQARQAGVAAVHQDLDLIPDAGIAENIFLWGLPRKAGFVQKREMTERVEQLLSDLGLDLDPQMPVGYATAVEQRLVMIAAALSQDAQVIILDEPTASLPPEEAELVMRVAERLRADGRTVLFVSHRLREVKRLSDRVVAMKEGRVVAEVPGDEVSIDGMIELIGGTKEVHDAPADQPLDVESVQAGRGEDVMVHAEGLTGRKVTDVDIDIHRGEILGVAGLVGAGRSEILRLLAERQAHTGTLDYPNGKPRIGYVAEAPMGNVFADFDVSDNVSLAALGRYSQAGFVQRGRITRKVTEILGKMRTRGDHDDPIWALSGGNRQKAMIGRWLFAESDLLLLDEPTAGIDIGARADVHRLLREFADAGGAVVVAIAEPNELLSLCDRVIVLVEGRSAGVVNAPFEEDQIVAMFYAHQEITA